MGNIGWIKLSTRIFDDEKIQLIEKMPEGQAILLAWIKLLVLGAQGNGDGTVRLSETIPYTDEMLAVIWRLPVAIVRLALQTFAGFGMIELHPDQTIEIVHWGVYQKVEDLERIRALGRERARRHRERKTLPESNVTSATLRLDKTRLEGNVTSNVTDKRKNRGGGGHGQLEASPSSEELPE